MDRTGLVIPPSLQKGHEHTFKQWKEGSSHCTNEKKMTTTNISHSLPIGAVLRFFCKNADKVMHLFLANKYAFYM